ncbi:MAG: phytoene/squalene synthase family protein [Phycisphaerales bacterium]|nr:phytoene/squalene synthase family protein [Phycisphaerales bacterium]
MTQPSLQSSYRYCHQLMRTAARNFYYGMRLLPPAKRNGMYTLYSYMRLCDDLADAPLDQIIPTGGLNQENLTTSDSTKSQRRQLLDQWRQRTHLAISGSTSASSEVDAHPLWPALADTVQRFSIPLSLFEDAIDGQLQDLEQNRYDTFAELYRYCYRVASTVGIAALYIWGFSDPQALKLAEYRGIAMQLTNILRDIREDIARDRQYLPQEDLARFNLSWPDLASPQVRPHLIDLLYFQIHRARSYYEQSAELENLICPDARPTLTVMTNIYRRILERISADPQRVLWQRVRLSPLEKLSVVINQTWQAHIAPLRA